MVVKLRDIADIQTGPFGSQLHEEDYVENGTPIVTVEHLGNRFFTKQNLPMVSDVDKKRLSKYTLKEGDIVFSRVGSVDRCSYVDKKHAGWLFSGRCLRVRPNPKKVNPLYLYYFFQLDSTKQQARNISVGATMSSLNTELIGSIDVLLPVYDEQTKIAAVLNSIDDKITINNEINDNLQRLMMDTYLKWFIQDKKCCNQNDNTISSIVNIQSGYSFKPDVYCNRGSYKLITIKNVQDDGIDVLSGDFIETLPNNLPTYCKLKRGDVLMSLTGNVGRVGLIYSENCLLNQRVAILQPRISGISPFIYCFFKSDYMRKKMEIISTGTSQKNLSPVDTEHLPFNHDLALAIKFSKIFNSAFGKIISSYEENLQLSNLRKKLLPLLMNGQISVR